MRTKPWATLNYLTPLLHYKRWVWTLVEGILKNKPLPYSRSGVRKANRCCRPSTGLLTTISSSSKCCLCMVTFLEGAHNLQSIAPGRGVLERKPKHPLLALNIWILTVSPKFASIPYLYIGGGRKCLLCLCSAEHSYYIHLACFSSLPLPIFYCPSTFPTTKIQRHFLFIPPISLLVKLESKFCFSTQILGASLKKCLTI